MTMRGLTCHPCVLMASMRGLYLSLLVSMVGAVYMSCVNVISIIWMVRWGVGMWPRLFVWCSLDVYDVWS